MERRKAQTTLSQHALSFLFLLFFCSLVFSFFSAENRNLYLFFFSSACLSLNSRLHLLQKGRPRYSAVEAPPSATHPWRPPFESGMCVRASETTRQQEELEGEGRLSSGVGEGRSTHSCRAVPNGKREKKEKKKKIKMKNQPAASKTADTSAVVPSVPVPRTCLVDRILFSSSSSSSSEMGLDCLVWRLGLTGLARSFPAARGTPRRLQKQPERERKRVLGVHRDGKTAADYKQP